MGSSLSGGLGILKSLGWSLEAFGLDLGWCVSELKRI